MSDLHYYVIESVYDDYLEEFLNRLQDDFPPHEQEYVSYFIRTLKKQEQGHDAETTLLCALEGEGGPLIGMACYEMKSEHTVVLWYLSVAPEKRSVGLGSQFYQEIIRRVCAQRPSVRYLFYEVERPDQAHAAEEADIARRRINFYRSHGGQLGVNVIYWQKVRNEPRVMMYLMVHAFRPEESTSESILAAMQSAFGDAMEPVETLILD